MTKRTFSLDALKQQFAAEKQPTNSGNNGNYYPFWNIAFGEQAIVRFLPDKDVANPWFLLEKSHHDLIVDGERKRVNCLKNYNEDCPICKASQQFYKNGDEAAGQQLYRKRQYLGQVLIMDDPLPVDKETGKNSNGEVKIVSLGPKIYASIKDSIETGELDEAPHSYEDGTNFIIKKSQDGKYADYSRSKFERRPTTIAEDLIDGIEDQLVTLTSLLAANPGAEALSQLLNNHLNGGVAEPAVPTYSAPSVAAAVTAAPVAAPTPATAPTPVVSDDSVDDDAEAVLAQLRARRNKVQ